MIHAAHILLAMLLVGLVPGLASAAPPDKKPGGADATSAAKKSPATGSAGAANPTGSRAAAAQSAASDLERAYMKEFAFLDAEKRALEDRVAGLTVETEKKTQAADAEIKTLQGRMMSLGESADRLDQALAEAERELDVALESEDVLDTTLSQAQSQLERGGVTLPEVEDPDAQARVTQLRTAFEESTALLDRYGGLYTVEGTYFETAGRELKGKVIHIGNVAAYGVGKESGALAPVGDGKLKIWGGKDTSDVARALDKGDPPKVLGLFLYESVDKSVEERREKTLKDVMRAGGVIAWIIVALGMVALAMVAARAVILARVGGNTEGLVAELAPLLRRGEFERAALVCDRQRGAAARVLGALLRSVHLPRERIEDVASERMLKEVPTIDRFGQAIIVIAAVSPLLGLLGTVTGMIATFDVITEFGTGNPKLLSGGISEALITTEFGLAVAIPGLLLGNLLGAWAERIKSDVDHAALRVLNIAAGNEVRQEVPTDGSPTLSPGLSPAK